VTTSDAMNATVLFAGAGGSSLGRGEQAGDAVKRTPRGPSRWGTFRLPVVGLTKEDYERLVALRNGRPLTLTDPIHKRNIDDGTQHDGMTPLERVIAESRTGEQE